MTLAALAFAAGTALLQLQPELPPLASAWLLPALALIALRYRKAAIPASLAAGFLWAALCAHSRMGDWLSPELEGRDLDVVGVVSSLPAIGERGARFEFDVESAKHGDNHHLSAFPKKLLISWFRSAPYEEGAALLQSAVHPGERWL